MLLTLKWPFCFFAVGYAPSPWNSEAVKNRFRMRISNDGVTVQATSPILMITGCAKKANCLTYRTG